MAAARGAGRGAGGFQAVVASGAFALREEEEEKK